MKAEKKHGKAKKVGIIVGVCIVVLTAAQLVTLGAMGGIGPLGFLKENRIAALPGNGEQFSFDHIVPLENSPLAGKKICVLGSSVVYGTASNQSAVGEYLAARFDCALTKEAVGGTTLVDNGNGSYIQRMLNNIPKDEQFDLFVCQLSTNDASKKLPLGEISTSGALEDFDTSTVTGAMEYIICYAKETWGCPVVFFTGSYYDNAEYAAMVAQINSLSEKWDIGVLDLYSNTEFNAISDADRSLYMNDKIHPTKAGYRDWWGPELERQLIAFLQQ